MFMNKKSVITVFKILSLIFVCFMLYVFLNILFANEKINPEIIKIENEINTFKDYLLSSNNFFYIEDVEETSCVSRYMSYYAYALVLGAYINFKRLAKLGPI
jgi:hypothetical protein